MKEPMRADVRFSGSRILVRLQPGPGVEVVGGSGRVYGLVYDCQDLEMSHPTRVYCGHEEGER